jgi:hypothetical protein
MGVTILRQVQIIVRFSLFLPILKGGQLRGSAYEALTAVPEDAVEVKHQTGF